MPEVSVKEMHSQIGQIWATLAYMLVNKDDALMANSVLMGLDATGMGIGDEARKKLEGMAAQKPKPTSI